MLSIGNHTSVHMYIAIGIVVEKGIACPLVRSVLDLPVDGLLQMRQYFKAATVYFPQMENVDSFRRPLLQKSPDAFSKIVTLGDSL